MTTIPRSLLTADEFLEMAESDGHELVDGQLVEVAMGMESNWYGGELFGEVREHVKANDLGRAFPQDSGIQVWDDDPNRVRKPDLSYFKKGRIPEPMLRGWIRVVPDLVAEVVSPNDLAEALQRKIRDYRNAGVGLIWVIYPDTRTAYVYRRGHPIREVEADGTLDGEDVLPGFSLSLAALFATAQGQAPPPAEAS
ncbi:MAG: Uma2 family endonuclease [Dehalococcoidia bacterium]